MTIEELEKKSLQELETLARTHKISVSGDKQRLLRKLIAHGVVLEDQQDSVSFLIEGGDRIPWSRIEDLLVTAFEGGSSYWYLMIDSYNYPPGKSSKDFKIPYEEVVPAGGSIVFDTGVGLPVKILDQVAVKRGLELMRRTYRKHYDDFINEDEDAITADVFLQLALYGDVVFHPLPRSRRSKP